MPYELMKAIGSHVSTLEVPEGTRGHKAVHNRKLKAFRRRDESQTMHDNDVEVWEGAAIIESGTGKGVLPYRMRWEGCTEFEDT